MLESPLPRECAAPSSVPIASSYEGSVNVVKLCARSSDVENGAAGNPLSWQASPSSGCGAGARGGKNAAGHGSGAADGGGPSLSSYKSSPANTGGQAAKATGDIGAFSPAAATATLTLPHNDGEVTEYVLYDGLPRVGPASRRAHQQQSEAYYEFQHRIYERAEAAHALVLSANPLSLSVMASQLRMYRWRVTQAQTLTEATTILQDYVIHTVKHGFRVRRRAPLRPGQSRYAHGRGRTALKRRAQAELERLSSVKPAAQGGTGAAADAMDMRKGATAAPRPANDRGVSDSHPTERAEEDAELNEDDVESDAESSLPPPPPDALPRLVLVDSFTHEDLGDIARHVRFVDKEKGLELLLVLLLPSDTGTLTTSMQGSGCVVKPAHQITMEDAYAAGYDLVLARSMDHLLADFFTSAFMSSVGRWRNDVRSKAAVGNYMSLRSVLLGGLNTDALQQIVWDDRVDDAGVLEALGAQSLCTQSAAQRYGEAARNLCQQQSAAAVAEACARQAGSGASRSIHRGSAESDADLEQSQRDSLSVIGVPRLRSRPVSVARYGVRLPAHHSAPHEPISDFSTGRDVFSTMMQPTGSSRRSSRRRRGQIGGAGGAEGFQHDVHYAEDREGESNHHQRLLQGALENELGRLLAENESQQASIDTMQEELQRLHRTVAVLRRHHPGAPGAAGEGANANNLPERPESGSTVHLSKQQQIYILKERLEMANDRIVALLKGERLSGSHLSPHRRGKFGGRDIGSRRRRDDSAAGTRKNSVPPSGLSRDPSFFTRATVQEAEQMAALDSDANFSLTQLELHSQEVNASVSDAASQAAAVRKQRKEREVTDQLIRSLQVELNELQERLDDTRFTGSGAEAESSEGLQARMAGRLQSMLEVLEAQKARIRHLEELRQMDQLLLKANLNRQAAKGRRKKSVEGSASLVAGIGGGSDEADDGGRDKSSSADEDENEGSSPASTRGGARGRKARQPRATGRRVDKFRGGVKCVAAGRKGATGSGTGVGAPKRFAKGCVDDVDDVDIDSAQEEEMEELAAQRTEAAVNAAVHDAVTSLQRTHQRQLAALIHECKSQLSRVALKLQRPSTSAYVALLREELTRAQRDQRGAWMRLRFTLSNLDPGQYDASLAKRAASSATLTASLGAMTATTTRGPDATVSVATAIPGDGADMVPLGAVTDPNVRRMAADIAREYAAYGLRIAYTTSELQRVERGVTALKMRSRTGAAAPAMPAVSDAPLDQLLSACQRAKARVQQTIDACGSVQEYLGAVQAELVAEQQLRPWCDVNSVELFASMHTAPSPASPVTAASQSPPQTPSPSSVVLVPSALHLGASASDAAGSQDGSQNDEHPPTASLNDDQVVLLADVDANMRDIADVYATLLRAQTPRISGAAMSISAAAGGSRNRREASLPTRVRERRDPDRRQRAFASPKHPTPAASPGKTPPQSAATAAGGSPDALNSLLPLHRPAGLTLEEALAKLPVQPGDVACYQGQLGRIYISEGVHSAAQQRLYEVILRAYRQYRIHPLHMAAVECAVSSPPPAVLRRGGGILKDDSSESLNSESDALLDAMFAQAGAAHVQHREVVALLELTAPTMTRAIRALTKELQRVQRLLDREDSSVAFAGAFSGTGPPCTSPALLSAVDAAILGCIVDELRWRHSQRLRKGRENSSHAAPLSAAGAAPSELVTALALTRRHRSGDSGGTPTDEGDASPQDARAIAHYAAFCAARERAAGNARSSRRSSLSESGGSQSSEAEDFFHLTDVPPMPSNAGGSDGADAGLTVARELAVLFRKRHPRDADEGDDMAAAMLEGIYLDDRELGGDSNTEAMRSIRRELEYLQGMKQQRMRELMMRFELHKERCIHSAGSRGGSAANVGAANGHDSDSRSPLPPVDPDRLGFEVKSGSAAWYGMEAAKRVHDILRRRARPDQIIVGGGPHGGSVGIELSRRTAQPASRKAGSSKANTVSNPGAASDSGVLNPEDEGYACSSDDEEAMYATGAYASHQQPSRRAGRTAQSTTHLPPLRQHRLLRAQCRGTTGAGDAAAHWVDDARRCGPHGQEDGLASPGDSAALMKDIGYLSPRDYLSLNAYGQMTAGGAYYCSFAGQPFHAAGDLTEQVLAYREALKRAAGRALPIPFTTYANGAPYCLPLSTPSASSRQVGDSSDARHDAQGRRLPAPVLMPEVTSWVYGVPEVYASTLVQQQNIDSQQPPDTVLFMPRYERSHLAEVEGRQRAGVRPAAVTPALSHRHLFFSGATTAASAYSTPAAFAAQRLDAMLSVSMSDPSVAAAAAAAVAATTGSRASLPMTQGRAYPLQPRRKGGAPATQRVSLAHSSTERALASVIAASAGADDTVPPSPSNRRGAGEGKVLQPHRESLSLEEKGPNSLDATLSPKRGGSA
ncbi:hypothetical protein JIQ42_07865 [Leishmania sp. Namibia]|uniref:hypothetical protein n=1 Tax=Leishmania sp. Namibia TaxID=2802991 RepID=UPI001B494BBC|nr:hypothetical protein JIQ42_07865 [Leishmania sp. Namibia]